MKKLLSILLSVIMVFSVATPVLASTEKATTTQISAVQDQMSADIKGELEFLNITPSVNAAATAYTYFRATNAKAHGFLTELDVNLAKNGGKILVAGSEDVVTYAAVINILTILGENPADYKGFDIVSAFETASATCAVSNPYYYRIVVEACKNINNTKLAQKYIDEFIAGYYKMGQGMDYWGVSCDNTAVFLTAIAPYADLYTEYVTDAKKVLNTYTTYEGCFYSQEYSDISADSTAVTMMAYAALGDFDEAYMLYKALMKNFESKTDNGVIFCYGSNNAYATQEALLALTYFDATKLVHHYNTVSYRPYPKCSVKGVKVYTCDVCMDEKTESMPALGDKGHAPILATKAVASTAFATGKTASYKCEYCGKILEKSKTVAKKGVAITKASAKNGKINLTYTKVKGAKGYQICFSKSKSFKTKKSFNVKSNSTKITGLTKGKTYYVKVRAYKLVKGKKVYSSWSTVKAVKVK